MTSMRRGALRSLLTPVWSTALALLAWGCGDGEVDAGADATVRDDSGANAGKDAGATADGAGSSDALLSPDAGDVGVRIGGHWVVNEHGSSGDGFGASVAIDGDRAFVGAPGVRGSGAVYVFRSVNDIWLPVAELTPIDGRGGDSFGASVAVEGSTLAVGAPGRTSLFADAGEVYLFHEIDGVWIPSGKLTRDPGSPSNSVGSHGNFGRHVALAARHAIVAAPGEGRSVASGGVNPDVGAIYVFDRSASGFGGPTALRASGTNPDDFFSSGMSSDGDHIVGTCISARCWARAIAFTAATGWSEQVIQSGGARLGPLVAVDRGRIALQHGSTDVALFELQNGAWMEKARAFEGAPASREVLAVELEGSALWVATGGVGSPMEGQLTLFETGGADTLEPVATTSLSADFSADAFGSALDADGTWGAVGARNANGGQGAVRFFTLVAEGCSARTCPRGACGRRVESDGCGGQLDCGGCPAPQTCGGGGVSGICGCMERVVTLPGSPALASGSGRWTNAERIAASDDVRAEARALISGETSGSLVASDFGLTLPTAASIEGIEVHIERNGDSALADDEVRLLKGGVLAGEDRARSGPWSNTSSDTVAVYGHAADRWGETWTPEDIASPDFGIAFSARYTQTAGNGTVEVDHVTVRVYFTQVCQ